MSSEKADLKRAILEVSLQLGTELGEEGLTMRGIAGRLGVSATALYQHFESKAAILRAIQFYGVELLGQHTAKAFDHDDPMKRLFEQGVLYIDFACQNPWLYCTLMEGEEPDMSQLTDREKTLVGKANEGVMNAFRDAKERGQLRDDIDIAAAPFVNWAALHGLASLMIRGRISEKHPIYPISDAQAFVAEFVRGILRGFQG